GAFLNAVDQCIWYYVSCFVMLGKLLQHLRVLGPVFHHLRWQLYKVAWHRGARQAMVMGFGQQAMQGMTKFMEKSSHFIEAEQSRLIITGSCEIAHNGNNRVHKFTCLIHLLLTVTAHPGSTALAGTGVHVNVQNTYMRTIGLLH